MSEKKMKKESKKKFKRSIKKIGGMMTGMTNKPEPTPGKEKTYVAQAQAEAQAQAQGQAYVLHPAQAQGQAQGQAYVLPPDQAQAQEWAQAQAQAQAEAEAQAQAENEAIKKKVAELREKEIIALEDKFRRVRDMFVFDPETSLVVIDSTEDRIDKATNVEELFNIFENNSDLFLKEDILNRVLKKFLLLTKSETYNDIIQELQAKLIYTFGMHPLDEQNKTDIMVTFNKLFPDDTRTDMTVTEKWHRDMQLSSSNGMYITALQAYQKEYILLTIMSKIYRLFQLRENENQYIFDVLNVLPPEELSKLNRDLEMLEYTKSKLKHFRLNEKIFFFNIKPTAEAAETSEAGEGSQAGVIYMRENAVSESTPYMCIQFHTMAIELLDKVETTISTYNSDSENEIIRYLGAILKCTCKRPDVSVQPPPDIGYKKRTKHSDILLCGMLMMSVLNLDDANKLVLTKHISDLMGIIDKFNDLISNLSINDYRYEYSEAHDMLPHQDLARPENFSDVYNLDLASISICINAFNDIREALYMPKTFLQPIYEDFPEEVRDYAASRPVNSVSAKRTSLGYHSPFHVYHSPLHGDGSPYTNRESQNSPFHE